jgi:hypothetical protein
MDEPGHGIGMEPTTATAELPGEVWRRVVTVAAMVSALVGGVVTVPGARRRQSRHRGSPHPGVQAPALGPSCRQLIAFPKRGWDCVDHR